jgi:hypothetical protein
VPYDEVYLTGPRITLWFAALIVVSASAYGFKTLRWREAEEGVPVDLPEIPAEEPAHA